MNRIYKNIVIFFLLQSATAMQAGWKDFFAILKKYRPVAQKIVAYAQPFCWPYNLYWKSAVTTKNYLVMHNKQFIEEARQAQLILITKYPKTFSYVQTELTNAGINPKSIIIIEDDRFSANDLCLYLPLNDFEQDDDKKKHDLFQSSLAHEIGHLKRYASIKKIFAPLISCILTKILLPYKPKTNNVLLACATNLGSACIKTLLATSIIHLWDSYEEYQADTYAIKRFSEKPEDKQFLLNEGQYYLKAHSNYTVAFMKRHPLLAKCSWLLSSPLFWQLRYISCFSYPSDLSRATRFLNANKTDLGTQLFGHLATQTTQKN